MISMNRIATTVAAAVRADRAADIRQALESLADEIERASHSRAFDEDIDFVQYYLEDLAGRLARRAAGDAPRGTARRRGSANWRRVRALSRAAEAAAAATDATGLTRVAAAVREAARQ